MNKPTEQQLRQQLGNRLWTVKPIPRTNGKMWRAVGDGGDDRKEATGETKVEALERLLEKFN